MDIIRLLPEHLANQIAAGEVVQRPASVVKELLENAVDAGARSVKLVVRDAGRTLVQVTDDGRGMSETDARLSLERHATSKIRETEDLFRIRTFGFRGEALASIAAVARLELKTCLQGADTGTCLLVESNRVLSQEPCAAPVGTTITVRDLFYNVPARRAFLKTNAVEMRHILDEFQRVALAHPELAFSLHHNELEIFSLPAAKLAQRVVAVLGAGYKSHLAACEEDTPTVRVQGYIGQPAGARKARGDQFFFVNGRYIRSAYLNHAVTTAYEGLLAKDAHPFYVLFLDLDPKEIDINVHPTKTEIKFADERTVYAIVCAAVRRALGLYNLAPSLDFEGDVNFAFIQRGGRGAPVAGASTAAAGSPTAGSGAPRRATSVPTRRSAASPLPASTFESESLPAAPVAFSLAGLPDTLATVAPPVALSGTAAAGSPAPLTAGGAAAAGLFPDHAPAQAPAHALPAAAPEAGGGVKLLQLHQRYLLVPVRSGLLVVDQQAARERILYEEYERGSSRPAVAQALLFPQALHFGPADYELVLELLPELEALGFRLRPLGPRALAAEAVPADLPATDVQALLDGVLDQVREGREAEAVRLGPREQVARAVARRAGTRFTQRLTEAEMTALVDRLFACQTPNYTPDGRRTLSILAQEQLAALLAGG